MKYFLVFILLTVYFEGIRSDSCTSYSIQTESYHVEPCNVPGSFCCGGCANRYCCDRPEKKLEQTKCGSGEVPADVTKILDTKAEKSTSSDLFQGISLQSFLWFLLALLITLILCCCIPLMCCLCCRDCFRVCGFGGRDANNGNAGAATYGNGFGGQMRKRFDNFFGSSSYNNQAAANTTTTNYVTVAQDDFSASQNIYRTNNNQANTVEFHEFSEVRRTYN